MIVGYGAFQYYKSGEVKREVQKRINSPQSPFKALKYSQETKLYAKKILQAPQTKSKNEKEELQYLNEMMKDPIIEHFFNYTLEFFDKRPEAYPAARFVSLALRFDSSTPEHISLMTRTIAEVKANSKPIYDTILKKQNEIYANPYFHNKMLNLVNQVQVTPEQKIKIYAGTIEKPIEFQSNGWLTESSDVLEVALILSRQSSEDPTIMVPIIQRSLANNPSEKQKIAIRSRVLNQYPNLSYLF